MHKQGICRENIETQLLEKNCWKWTESPSSGQQDKIYDKVMLLFCC